MDDTHYRACMREITTYYGEACRYIDNLGIIVNAYSDVSGICDACGHAFKTVICMREHGLAICRSCWRGAPYAYIHFDSKSARIPDHLDLQRLVEIAIHALITLTWCVKLRPCGQSTKRCEICLCATRSDIHVYDYGYDTVSHYALSYNVLSHKLCNMTPHHLCGVCCNVRASRTKNILGACVLVQQVLIHELVYDVAMVTLCKYIAVCDLC